MTPEQQFQSDSDTFRYFMEEGSPSAAIKTLAEAFFEKDVIGNEWLDKSIDILFREYIANYPFPGYPVMKDLLAIVSRYLEINQNMTLNQKRNFFSHISWWLVQSEGHFQWLVKNHSAEDHQMRWALRMIFRKFIAFSADSGGKRNPGLSLANTLLMLIDPEFVSSVLVIYDVPVKEHTRDFSFQRPFRFTHNTCAIE